MPASRRLSGRQPDSQDLSTPLALVHAFASPARALLLDTTGANLTMSLDALLIVLLAGLAIVLGVALLHYRRQALESSRGMAQLEERLQAEAAARHRAEQAQRRTEERYRTPADQVKDYAIYIMDDQGRHRSWNEGVQRLLGYGKTEFLAASSADLFAPEDCAAGLPEQELAEAIAHGRSTGDQQLVRKDGSRFWASVSTTVVHSRQGELLGFAKRLRDLSEMRRVEEELRRNQEALELAHEAAGSCVGTRALGCCSVCRRTRTGPWPAGPMSSTPTTWPRSRSCGSGRWRSGSRSRPSTG
ncbi:MAG: sensor histidine kinase [Geminicoccaceae bacterium]|nr:sensor histidine kinase [Geminicoccaceae bacterium]